MCALSFNGLVSVFHMNGEKCVRQNNFKKKHENKKTRMMLLWSKRPVFVVLTSFLADYHLLALSARKIKKPLLLMQDIKPVLRKVILWWMWLANLQLAVSLRSS